MAKKSENNSYPIGRRVKGLIGTNYTDIDKWPTPDEGALKKPKLTEYLKRKRGVKLYLEGQSEKVVRKASGLPTTCSHHLPLRSEISLDLA